ncbi:MAG TPA: molybdopterin molybdotransferase MoeA [Planctomycetota bacterium]|nr:molybdopterin molybdotransferase MoeA [Planctomycetota bacterium]
MIDVAGALAAIAAIPVARRGERVALDAALWRTAADDLRLPRDQPPFDRATMDGFAVALAPATTRYRVVGTVAAGGAFDRALMPGEAVKIMTGAPTPAGATVVPYEVARVEGDQVECDPQALVARRNIAARGEDGRAGQVVIQAGTRLSPAVLAVAAGCGAREIAVATAPRVAIVVTGDEVGGSGEAGIADTNGPYLTAFCTALGLPSTRVNAPDRPEALRAALAAAADADLILSSGGVSGSDADHVAAVARELGFVPLFHGVAMQPGKPVLLARREDGRLLMGLPGNPVGLMAGAHVLLLPLIDRLLGLRRAWRALPLAAAIANKGKRRQFRPARLVDGGVRVLGWNGSGDFLAAAAADGFADLMPGVELKAGDRVPFLAYVGAVAAGLMPNHLDRLEPA